jgi:hypothetical protein
LTRSSPLDPEAGLITRPASTKSRSDICPRSGGVFQALIAGATLGEAAQQALAQHPDFDLPSAISAMLESGAFIGVPALNQPPTEETP